MTPGTHGSTFGGNPLAMAVGQAVLDVVLADGFLEDVRRKGLYLKQRLASVVDSHPDMVDEVRGEGLLIGVRCKVPVAEVTAAMRAEDMLGVGAGENVIRILPPLNVTEAELDEGVRRFDAALATLERATAARG
jgi:acetylornithine/N-succinyldiaminopimelate aminotransferase